MRLPEVPVIVTMAVPVVAVLLAVNVNVLAFVGLVVLVGLNDAITPAGKPEAAKLTLPVKPFCGATETVLVRLPPCTRLTLFGDADRLKFGGVTAFTVSDNVVVCVKPPEVPVIVTVTVPMVAVLLAESVNVLAFVGLVVLVGLKDAITPAGRPEADKLTLPVKPFSGATETVLVPLLP